MFRLKFDNIEDVKKYIDFSKFENIYDDIERLYRYALKFTHSKHVIMLGVDYDNRLKTKFKVAIGVTQIEQFDLNYDDAHIDVSCKNFNPEYWEKHNWI